MKVAVLINNYNYEKFVSEAIDSVFEQTYAVSELIVVDDGSTDNSRLLVQEKFDERPDLNTLLVAQENAGQLSAFVSGVRACTADLIFFLDADDLFKKNHVESIVEAANRNPSCEFFFSRAEEFGRSSSALVQNYPEGDLGQTQMFTLLGTGLVDTFVGGVTSTICLRSGLAHRVLANLSHFYGSWRTRADDFLVQGSSLLGARKFQVAEASVRYRLHGQNAFAGQTQSCSGRAERFSRSAALVGHYEKVIPLGPNSVVALGFEYQGLGRHSPFRGRFWKIALLGNIEFILRLRILWLMFKSHLKPERPVTENPG